MDASKYKEFKNIAEKKISQLLKAGKFLAADEVFEQNKTYVDQKTYSRWKNKATQEKQNAMPVLSSEVNSTKLKEEGEICAELTSNENKQLTGCKQKESKFISNEHSVNSYDKGQMPSLSEDEDTRNFEKLLCIDYDFNKADKFYKANHSTIKVDEFNLFFLDTIQYLIEKESDYQQVQDLFYHVKEKGYTKTPLQKVKFNQLINGEQDDCLQKLTDSIKDLLSSFDFEKADEIIDQKFLFTPQYQKVYEDYKKTYKEIKRKYINYQQKFKHIWSVIDSHHKIDQIISEINSIVTDANLYQIYNQKNNNTPDIILKIKEKIDDFLEKGELRIKRDNTYVDTKKVLCSQCDEEISPERLSTLPYTQYCARCQNSYETAVNKSNNKSKMIAAYIEEKQQEEAKSNSTAYPRTIKFPIKTSSEKNNKINSFPELIDKLSSDKISNTFQELNDKLFSDNISPAEIIRFLNKCRGNKDLYPSTINKLDKNLINRILNESNYKSIVDEADGDLKEKYREISLILGLIKDTQEFLYNQKNSNKFFQEKNRFLFYLSDFFSKEYNKRQAELKDYKDARYAVQQIEKETAIRLAARDKVISDMSHRIKNIINKLASPLRQLKGRENAMTINKALKGADLIREVINGFNYSYSGSFDDFIFDAKNLGDDALSFENILIDSTLPGIENMFDGKWFKVFLDQYFPDRNSFANAKKEWEELQAGTFPSLKGFCQQHLFDCSIKTAKIKDLKIGNTKGSKLKFIILFQELILNAVKYASFVERDKRFLSIDLKYKTNTGLTLIIANSFDPEIQEKETGLGHVIIETMCKLMHAEYNKSPDLEKNIFTIEIKFPDYWTQSNAPELDAHYHANTTNKDITDEKNIIR